MKKLFLILVWVCALAFPAFSQVRIPGPGGKGASGAASKALSFNGTSDYLKSSAAVTLGASTLQLSWSFWLYQNSNGSSDALAAESSANFNFNAGSFILDPNSGTHSGNFQYSLNAGAISSCTFPQASSGTFHQYVLTMDTSHTTTVCTAYVDGTAQTVTVNSSGAFGGGTTNQTVYLMSRAGSSLFNTGKLGDFAIYTGILTSTDATKLSGSTPVLANDASLSLTPVAYLHGCSASSPQVDVMTSSWNWIINGTTSVTGPAGLGNC